MIISLSVFSPFKHSKELQLIMSHVFTMDPLMLLSAMGEVESSYATQNDTTFLDFYLLDQHHLTTELSSPLYGNLSDLSALKPTSISPLLLSSWWNSDPSSRAPSPTKSSWNKTHIISFITLSLSVHEGGCREAPCALQLVTRRQSHQVWQLSGAAKSSCLLQWSHSSA